MYSLLPTAIDAATIGVFLLQVSPEQIVENPRGLLYALVAAIIALGGVVAYLGKHLLARQEKEMGRMMETVRAMENQNAIIERLSQGSADVLDLVRENNRILTRIEHDLTGR